MNENIVIEPYLTIPSSQITIFTAKSGGPGGQNVNKLNTKVFLRWHVSTCPDLHICQKILSECSTYVTQENDILISSTRYRTQHQNYEDCVQKLKKLVCKALRPKKKRIKTCASQTSCEKRLESKKRVAQKKKMRGRVDNHE